MSDDVVERARMVLRNDPGACTAETVAELLNEIEALHAEIEALRVALEASVRLQSHYALLLNEYDDGERMTFDDADAWMEVSKDNRTFKLIPYDLYRDLCNALAPKP